MSIGLRLLSSAVLWRLLDADDFGVMAVVMVFLQGIAMFSDVGIGPSIVQSKHGSDPDHDRCSHAARLERVGQ